MLLVSAIFMVKSEIQVFLKKLFWVQRKTPDPYIYDTLLKSNVSMKLMELEQVQVHTYEQVLKKKKARYDAGWSI